MSMQTLAGATQSLLFLPVGWETYERISTDLGDTPSYRLFYNGEVLEIMAPLAAHETYTRLLDSLLLIFALERGIDAENFGSTTLKAKPQGAEPDSCHYVEKAKLVIGRQTIDLDSDPAPDMALEVDLSHERLDKAAFYARLGIAEFWRYDGKKLWAGRLEHGGYVSVETSSVFPGLVIADVDAFMERRYTTSQSAIVRAWMERLKTQI